MDKIAVGPGYPEGIIDLAKSPSENVRAVAAAKGVEPGDIIVCVLDRPRQAVLIAESRALACAVVLIGAGDGARVTAVPDAHTTTDRQRAVRGNCVYVREDYGGCRMMKKNQ